MLRSTFTLIRPIFGTRRFSSVDSTLLHKVAAHYEQSGDSPSASLDLARQELKWIEEGAREQAGRLGGSWEDRMGGMVDQLVEQHMPLAYILGTQPFHPLPVPLLVRPPTLIPRPETEHWLTHLSSRFLPPPPSRPSLRILDIGTGSGCIALSLAHFLLPHYAVRALGVDQSSDAVQLARENVTRCSLSHEVEIVQADLFADGFATRAKGEGGAGFDLVVSNPPYITREAYTTLPPSVRVWEDRRALVGERAGSLDDGLVFYERILDVLPELLTAKPGLMGPVLAFEVGEGQAREVARRIELKGWRSEVVEDQWGVDRLVLGFLMSERLVLTRSSSAERWPFGSGAQSADVCMSSYASNPGNSSAYGSNSAQAGVGVGATADPTQYDSDRYDSSSFGQQGGNSATSGLDVQDSSPSFGGNNDSTAYAASENSTSAYGQGQSVGGDGAYGATGTQQSSFGTQRSESPNSRKSTSAYGQTQSVGGDGTYRAGARSKYDGISQVNDPVGGNTLGGNAGRTTSASQQSDYGTSQVTDSVGGNTLGSNTSRVDSSATSRNTDSFTGRNEPGSDTFADADPSSTRNNDAFASIGRKDASDPRQNISGRDGDVMATSGAGDSAPRADAVDQDGYPVQQHAGKVGYGPNYHAGPTVGDKIEGVKDIIKGKILKKPELVEEGRLKKTGEMAERKQAEDDANDPFAKEKEAQGGGLSDSQRDGAATAGSTQNY